MLQVWAFGDGVEVVEVVAVVCGVLRHVVVDGHAAQPAWTVFCFAFEEELFAVFFELTSALADLTTVADHVAVTPVIIVGSIGGLGEIRIRDPVAVFTGWHAIPA